MINKDITERHILVYSEHLLNLYKTSLNPNVANHSETIKKILESKQFSHFVRNSFSKNIFNNSQPVINEIIEHRKLVDKVALPNSELNQLLHQQINLKEYKFLNQNHDFDQFNNDYPLIFQHKDYKLAEETAKSLKNHIFDLYSHYPNCNDKEFTLNAIKSFLANNKNSDKTLQYFHKLSKKNQNDVDVCISFINRFQNFPLSSNVISEDIMNDRKFIKACLCNNFKNLSYIKEDILNNNQSIKELLPLTYQAYTNDSFNNSAFTEKKIETNYSKSDYLEHLLLDASSFIFFKNIPSFKIDISVVTNVLFGFYHKKSDFNNTVLNLFNHLKTENITFNDIETSEILEMTLELNLFKFKEVFSSNNTFQLLARINPKLNPLFEKLIDENINKRIETSQQFIIDSADLVAIASRKLCKEVLLEDLEKLNDSQTLKKSSLKKF